MQEETTHIDVNNPAWIHQFSNVQWLSFDNVVHKQLLSNGLMIHYLIMITWMSYVKYLLRPFQNASILLFFEPMSIVTQNTLSI